MLDQKLKAEAQTLMNLKEVQDFDDICPPWWPNLLWRLHVPSPPHWPGPGPVNYPPAIDNLMANLHIHTMSYLMRDQSVAQQIRGIAEQQMTNAVQNLSRDHEEARKAQAA